MTSCFFSGGEVGGWVGGWVGLGGGDQGGSNELLYERGGWVGNSYLQGAHAAEAVVGSDRMNGVLCVWVGG